MNMYESCTHSKKLNRISTTETPSAFLPVITLTKRNSFSDFQHHRLVLPIFEHSESEIINMYILVSCFFHSVLLCESSILLNIGVVHLSSCSLEFHCVCTKPC